MAIQIVIPNIPKVEIPKIPDFSGINKVKIDTSGIEAAVQATVEKNKEIKKSCLFAQLAPYKAMTISIYGKPMELSPGNKKIVTELVQEISANGWMNADTAKWCEENGIPF